MNLFKNKFPHDRNICCYSSIKKKEKRLHVVWIGSSTHFPSRPLLEIISCLWAFTKASRIFFPPYENQLVFWCIKNWKELPGSPCQCCSVGGSLWCSRSEYIYQLFHCQMQEGYFGGVTKQWSWQQLCALLVSKLVAENAGSRPIARLTSKKSD